MLPSGAYETGVGTMAATTTVRVDEALDALRVATGRVQELLRGVRDPGASAIGSWTIGETANHLAFAYTADAAVLGGEVPPVPGEVTQPGAIASDAVARMNEQRLAADPERDPAVLARRIGGSLESLLGAPTLRTPERRLSWLGGLQLPVGSVVAHLLGETIVHGYDIARAEGRPWPISREHALIIVRGFLLPVIAAFPPELRLPSAGDVSCEVRLRGDGRHILAIEDGHPTVLEAGTRAPDVRMSADPVGFMLLVYGRVGRGRLMLTGRIAMWGRRMWRAPRLAAMRTP